MMLRPSSSASCHIIIAAVEPVGILRRRSGRYDLGGVVARQRPARQVRLLGEMPCASLKLLDSGLDRGGGDNAELASQASKKFRDRWVRGHQASKGRGWTAASTRIAARSWRLGPSSRPILAAGDETLRHSLMQRRAEPSRAERSRSRCLSVRPAAGGRRPRAGAVEIAGAMRVERHHWTSTLGLVAGSTPRAEPLRQPGRALATRGRGPLRKQSDTLSQAARCRRNHHSKGMATAVDQRLSAWPTIAYSSSRSAAFPRR